MDIREQLYKIRFGKHDVMTFPDGVMCLNDKLIDKILEIPEIKKALSFIKLYEEDKLVKLADDQMLPFPLDIQALEKIIQIDTETLESATGEIYRNCFSHREDVKSRLNKYKDAQEDMINSNFKKVEKIGD